MAKVPVTVRSVPGFPEEGDKVRCTSSDGSDGGLEDPSLARKLLDPDKHYIFQDLRYLLGYNPLLSRSSSGLVPFGSDNQQQRTR